jgi:hypothetical protein
MMDAVFGDSDKINVDKDKIIIEIKNLIVKIFTIGKFELNSCCDLHDKYAERSLFSVYSTSKILLIASGM